MSIEALSNLPDDPEREPKSNPAHTERSKLEQRISRVCVALLLLIVLIPVVIIGGNFLLDMWAYNEASGIIYGIKDSEPNFFKDDQLKKTFNDIANITDVDKRPGYDINSSADRFDRLINRAYGNTQSISKYDDAIKRLSNNRIVKNNIYVANQFSELKATYDDFSRHAHAINKYAATTGQHKQLIDEVGDLAHTANNDLGVNMRRAVKMSELADIMINLKTGDQEFDTKLNDAFGNVKNLAQRFIDSGGNVQYSMSEYFSISDTVKDAINRAGDYCWRTIELRKELGKKISEFGDALRQSKSL